MFGVSNGLQNDFLKMDPISVKELAGKIQNIHVDIRITMNEEKYVNTHTQIESLKYNKAVLK